MSNDEEFPKAAELFNVQVLTELYVTSDKKGFTSKQKAERHASFLNDKKVEHFSDQKNGTGFTLYGVEVVFDSE